MADEYGPDLVTVLDDDGNEHTFELMDAIETDDGRFVALLPVYDDPSEEVNDDGELIILSVDDSTGEELLVQIEDDDLFEEIAGIFEERLSDLFEIEEMEDEADEPLQSSPLPAGYADCRFLTLLQFIIGSSAPGPDCRSPRLCGKKGAGTPRAGTHLLSLVAGYTSGITARRDIAHIKARPSDRGPGFLPLLAGIRQQLPFTSCLFYAGPGRQPPSGRRQSPPGTTRTAPAAARKHSCRRNRQ